MQFVRILVPLVLALSACSTSSSGQQSSAVEVDDYAILSTLSTFRSSPAFVHVNGESYATALGTGALIDVYVSANGFAPYASIVAEADGSLAEVPEGTVIVREVKEPSGAVKSLTLMYKGPPGYNPELNDFWFGVTDPAGVPVLQDGQPRTGRLADCYGCHLTRVRDGHLFGVPGANRPGSEPPPSTPPPPPPPTAAPLCGDFICNGIESCELCGFDCGICPGGDDNDGDDDGDDGGT